MKPQNKIYKNSKTKRWISVMVALIFLVNICYPAPLLASREGNYGSTESWELFTVAFALGLTSALLANLNPVGYVAGAIASDLVTLGMYYGTYNEYGAPFTIGGQQIKIFNTTVSKGQMYSMLAGVGASTAVGIGEGIYKVLAARALAEAAKEAAKAAAVAAAKAAALEAAAKAATEATKEAAKAAAKAAAEAAKEAAEAATKAAAKAAAAEAAKGAATGAATGAAGEPAVGGTWVAKASKDLVKGTEWLFTFGQGTGSVTNPYIKQGAGMVSDKVGSSIGYASLQLARDTGVGVMKLYASEGIKNYLQDKQGWDETVAGAVGGTAGTLFGVALSTGFNYGVSQIKNINSTNNGAFVNDEDNEVIEKANNLGNKNIGKDTKTGKDVNARDVNRAKVAVPAYGPVAPDGTLPTAEGTVALSDVQSAPAGSNTPGLTPKPGALVTFEDGSTELAPADTKVTGLKTYDGRTVSINADALPAETWKNVSAYQGFINSPQHYALLYYTGGTMNDTHGTPLAEKYKLGGDNPGWRNYGLGFVLAPLEGVRNLGFAPYVSAGVKIAVLKAVDYHTHYGRNQGKIYENLWKMALADAIGNYSASVVNNIDTLNILYAGTWRDQGSGKVSLWGADQNPWASRGAMSPLQYLGIEALKETAGAFSEIGWGYYARNNNLLLDHPLAQFGHLGVSVLAGSAMDAAFRRDPAKAKAEATVLTDAKGENVAIAVGKDRKDNLEASLREYEVMDEEVNNNEDMRKIQGDVRESKVIPKGIDSKKLSAKLKDDFVTLRDKNSGQLVMVSESYLEANSANKTKDGTYNLALGKDFSQQVAATSVQVPVKPQYKRLEIVDAAGKGTGKIIMASNVEDDTAIKPNAKKDGTFTYGKDTLRLVGESYGDPYLDGRLNFDAESLGRFGVSTGEDYNNYFAQAVLDTLPLPSNYRAPNTGLNGFMSQWAVQDKFSSYAAAGGRGIGPIRNAVMLLGQNLDGWANNRFSSSVAEAATVIALPSRFHQYAAFTPAYKLAQQEKELALGKKATLEKEIKSFDKLGELFGGDVSDEVLHDLGTIVLREAFEQGLIKDANTAELIRNLSSSNKIEASASNRKKMVDAITSIGEKGAEGIRQNLEHKKEALDNKIKRAEWWPVYAKAVPVLGNVAAAQIFAVSAAEGDYTDLSGMIRGGIINYHVERNIDIRKLTKEERAGLLALAAATAYKDKLANLANSEMWDSVAVAIKDGSFEGVQSVYSSSVAGVPQAIEAYSSAPLTAFAEFGGQKSGKADVIATPGMLILPERSKLNFKITEKSLEGVREYVQKRLADDEKPNKAELNKLAQVLNKADAAENLSSVSTLYTDLVYADMRSEIEDKRKAAPGFEKISWIPGEGDAKKASVVNFLNNAFPTTFYGNYALTARTQVDRFGRMLQTNYYGQKYDPVNKNWNNYVQLHKYTNYYYGPFGQEASVTRDYQYIELPEAWPSEKGTETREFMKGRAYFDFGKIESPQLQAEADRVVTEVRDAQSQGKEIKEINITMEGAADDVRVKPKGKLYKQGILDNKMLAGARAAELEKLIQKTLNDDSIKVKVGIAADVLNPGLGPFRSSAALEAAKNPDKRYASVSGGAELFWNNPLAVSVGPNITYERTMYATGGSNMPYGNPAAATVMYDINSGPALQYNRYYSISPVDVHNFITGRSAAAIFTDMLRQACLGTGSAPDTQGISAETRQQLDDSVKSYAQQFSEKDLSKLTPQQKETEFNKWVSEIKVSKEPAVTALAGNLTDKENKITAFLQTNFTRLIGVNSSVYRRVDGIKADETLRLNIRSNVAGFGIDNNYNEIPRFSRGLAYAYEPGEIGKALKGQAKVSAELASRIENARIYINPETGLAFLRESPTDPALNALYSYSNRIYLPPEYQNTPFESIRKGRFGTEAVVPIGEIPVELYVDDAQSKASSKPEETIAAVNNTEVAATKEVKTPTTQIKVKDLSEVGTTNAGSSQSKPIVSSPAGSTKKPEGMDGMNQEQPQGVIEFSQGLEITKKDLVANSGKVTTKPQGMDEFYQELETAKKTLQIGEPEKVAVADAKPDKANLTQGGVAAEKDNNVVDLFKAKPGDIVGKATYVNSETGETVDVPVKAIKAGTFAVPPMFITKSEEHKEETITVRDIGPTDLDKYADSTRDFIETPELSRQDTQHYYNNLPQELRDHQLVKEAYERKMNPAGEAVAVNETGQAQPFVINPADEARRRQAVESLKQIVEDNNVQSVPVVADNVQSGVTNK